MPFEQKVEEHHILEFKDAAKLAAQQIPSVLRPHVSEQQCRGEAANLIDLFDPVEEQDIDDRAPENPDNRPNRRRRWLTVPNERGTGQMIDKIDTWRQLSDHTSMLMRNHMAGVNRGIDKDIIQGMTGPALEGKYGAMKSVAFPAANRVGADLRDEDDTGSGNTGLNVRKLRRLRRKLVGSEIDPMGEVPRMGISAAQMEDLTQYVTITSRDFNLEPGEQPVLKEGKVTYFMGFMFVECERWGYKSGTTDIRENVAWLPSAVTLGIWQDVDEMLWNDTSKMNRPRFAITRGMDCRRGEDEGVYICENLEAAA